MWQNYELAVSLYDLMNNRLPRIDGKYYNKTHSIAEDQIEHFLLQQTNYDVDSTFYQIASRQSRTE